MMWNKVNNEQKAKPKIIFPKMSSIEIIDSKMSLIRYEKDQIMNKKQR